MIRFPNTVLFNRALVNSNDVMSMFGSDQKSVQLEGELKQLKSDNDGLKKECDALQRSSLKEKDEIQKKQMSHCSQLFNQAITMIHISLNPRKIGHGDFNREFTKEEEKSLEGHFQRLIVEGLKKGGCNHTKFQFYYEFCKLRAENILEKEISRVQMCFKEHKREIAKCPDSPIDALSLKIESFDPHFSEQIKKIVELYRRDYQGHLYAASEIYSIMMTLEESKKTGAKPDRDTYFKTLFQFYRDYKSEFVFAIRHFCSADLIRRGFYEDWSKNAKVYFSKLARKTSSQDQQTDPNLKDRVESITKKGVQNNTDKQVEDTGKVTQTSIANTREAKQPANDLSPEDDANKNQTPKKVGAKPPKEPLSATRKSERLKRKSQQSPEQRKKPKLSQSSESEESSKMECEPKLSQSSESEESSKMECDSEDSETDAVKHTKTDSKSTEDSEDENAANNNAANNTGATHTNGGTANEGTKPKNGSNLGTKLKDAAKKAGRTDKDGTKTKNDGKGATKPKTSQKDTVKNAGGTEEDATTKPKNGDKSTKQNPSQKDTGKSVAKQNTKPTKTKKSQESLRPEIPPDSGLFD